MKNFDKKIVCVLTLAILLFLGITAGKQFLVSWTDFLTKPGYEAKILELESDINAVCTTKFPYASELKGIYGFTAKLLNQIVIPDAETDVYRLKNGQLAYLQPDAGDPSIAINSLSEFNNWLSEQGIKYLHVVSAQTADERQGQLPNGIITDYCEEATTTILEGLQKNGANCLGAYDLIANAPGDYYDYFYRTDHHWNEQAALIVSKAIGEEVKRLGYDLKLENLEKQEYDSKIYENIWLGSCGKKATIPYVMPEDFEILLPRFETNFNIKIPFTGLEKTGSYEEVLIDYSYLDYDYYNLNCYASFLYGDQDLIQIENLNDASGPRVLVLKDSKANVVDIHLSTVFSHLDIIDLRMFHGSLKEYIKQTKPDIVITLYSPFVRSADPDYIFD